MKTAKKIEKIVSAPPMHWVGDGFPVSSVISPQTVRNRLSPYILLDHAGPAKFEPAKEPRGVDTHPHRGFETVTVVFQGELEHRDSAGNSGSIGPGDVQWMTAASGVLHEEKHSKAFTRAGGTLEMAQLWVNLPAKYKMTPPRYQTLMCESIPVVDLKNEAGAGAAGTARIIAGEFNETAGAAKTVTPVILWDVKLKAGTQAWLPIPSGFNSALYLRTGSVSVGVDPVKSKQLAVLESEGDGVLVQSDVDAEFLVVGGEPIDEEVVAYGPFVMNTAEEIQTAINDVRAGKFGRLD